MSTGQATSNDALPVTTATASVSGFASALMRYPYLTDTVLQNATVNFATNQSGTSASVKYGPLGSCTANTVNATRTDLIVNSVNEYQWKAQLTVAPNTLYCFRVYLGTTDLLGTNGSPQFWSQLPAGSTEPFTFAVFGDWGATNSSGSNPDQANLMAQLAASGARFAVSTGDNSYPSGSQTNYGDLVQRGADISGVFGPSFWAQVGASMPLFPAIGNHGFPSTATLHPHLQNFPQDTAVASSGGRYQMDTYPSVNGTTSASYPSTWYAFDAGVARFYVLEAAWTDSNVGKASAYKDDHDSHWTPSSAEYVWLKNDLAAHSSQIKFAFLHYPLYSDNASESSDTYLQGANNLEGLLNLYQVSIAFEGHSHNYQRFSLANAGSVLTHVTGGGGAPLTSISSCKSFDAYAIGWSSAAGGGSSCHAANPASAGQVFHFLLVTVNGSNVTVKAVNSQGTTFDQHSYTFGSPSAATATPTATSTPGATPTAPASANQGFRLYLSLISKAR